MSASFRAAVRASWLGPIAAALLSLVGLVILPNPSGPVGSINSSPPSSSLWLVLATIVVVGLILITWCLTQSLDGWLKNPRISGVTEVLWSPRDRFVDPLLLARALLWTGCASVTLMTLRGPVVAVAVVNLDLPTSSIETVYGLVTLAVLFPLFVALYLASRPVVEAGALVFLNSMVPTTVISTVEASAAAASRTRVETAFAATATARPIAQSGTAREDAARAAPPDDTRPAEVARPDAASGDEP